MGLSVRSSRCVSISMIIFGFLTLIPSATYIAFSLIFWRHPVFWREKTSGSTLEFILLISWHLGYTSLLALITMITGCIGCCASGHRAHRDLCQIVTLFIFSLIVAGLSAYTIFDFSVIISAAKYLTNQSKFCHKEKFCGLLFIILEGSLLGLAILVLLLSSWAIICCIASFCCHTEVEPEPVPARQQMVGGQQGVMMQGAVMVPMMRTDTMPVMAAPNPAMVQAVPLMPVSQAVPVAPVNQAVQQPTQAMPVQVVAIPEGMKTTQGHYDETVA